MYIIYKTMSTEFLNTLFKRLDDTPKHMNFDESVDVRACKYISTMTLADFTDVFAGVDAEYNQKELRDYHKQLKAYCHRMIAAGGKQSLHYKCARGRCSGRIYTKDFGIQRLSQSVREMIAPAEVKDYDMKNCHPTILLRLLKGCGLPCSYLEQYVADRDEVLREYGLDKRELLALMNMDKPPKRAKGGGELHTWTKCLLTELKMSKGRLVELTQSRYPTTNTKNPISSHVDKLLCDCEDHLLQTAVGEFNLSSGVDCTPMFDGLMTTRDLDIGRLNELSSDWGIRWVIKKWVKRDTPIDFDDTDAQSYEATKAQFEETYFRVNNPLMWFRGEIGSAAGAGGVRSIPRADFKDHAEEYVYVDEKTQQQRGIFGKWLSDPTKRCFESITNHPFSPAQQDPTPPDVYNEFVPFPVEYRVEGHPRYACASVKCPTGGRYDFQDLIYYLCQTEEEEEYLYNFAAHLVQHPDVNPQVLVVLKGHIEGVGKDTYVRTLAALVGRDKAFDTSDMEDVFGKYNANLDSKLIVQFNEAQGNQGATFNDKLKHHVTATTNTIRQKYVVDKTQPNYVRYVVASNHFNPIVAGRRTLICQTRCEERITDDRPLFWETYYELLGNQHFLDSLYSDLMDVDLTDFDITKPPVTEVQANKQAQNILPIHQFLQRVAERGFPLKANSVFAIKNSDDIGIKPKHFYSRYSDFLCDSEDAVGCVPGSNTNQRKVVFNWLLEYTSSIKMDQKRRDVSGKQIRCMTIDRKGLLQSLKNGKKYTDPEAE